MTFAERLAESRERRGVPMCACGVRHDGAAWTPALGWHDFRPSEQHAPHALGAACSQPEAIHYNLSEHAQSPFTRCALAAQLPGKVVA